jgi:hypothetical protein
MHQNILTIFYCGALNLMLFCSCKKQSANTAPPPPPQPTNGQIVTTFAGSTAGGFADGAGAAAKFQNPSFIAADAQGNLFVEDWGNKRIRKITSAGVVTTVAGSGTNGYDDGTGSAASFGVFAGIAVDAVGNVFVADYNRVRKLSTAGLVTTIAGSRTQGFLDGQDTTARFSWLAGIAVDNQGNVYVGDNGNDYSRIRKITSSGAVTTVAGGAKGNADAGALNSKFEYIVDVAIDAQGNLFIADAGNHKIRKLNTAGQVSTISTSTSVEPLCITTDASSNFYFTQSFFSSGSNSFNSVYQLNNSEVVKIAGTASFQPGYADGDGLQAKFNDVWGLAADAQGNIYVADRGNNCIRKIKKK